MKLAIGALALVLLGVGGGFGLTQLRGSEDDSSAPGTRELPVADRSIDRGISILGEPRTQWEVEFAELERGGYPYTTEYGQIIHDFGDTIVIGVDIDEGDDDYEDWALHGIDASDGTSRWSLDMVGSYSECFPVLEDSRLLCQNGSIDDDSLASLLIDPTTGERVADTDVLLQGVTSSASWIYAVSAADVGDWEDTYPVDIHKYDADLNEVWVSRGVDPGPNKDMGNEFDGGPYTRLDGNSVIVSYGYLTWIADESTGSIIERSRAYSFQESLQPYRGRYDDASGEDRTLVIDSTGNTLISATGAFWSGLEQDVYSEAQVSAGAVGIGDSMYDVSTGDVVWSRPDQMTYDEYGERYWSWAPDGSQVIAPGDGEVALLSAESGEESVRIPQSEVDGYDLWTDDALALVDASGGLVVYSRYGTGQAWSEQLYAGDDPEYFNATIGRSDSAVYTVSESSIRGFTDFAEPEPGLRGDGAPPIESVDGAEDPGYYTDCGELPDFEPVEAVSGGGGVTITYEITATCPGGQWLNHSALRVPLQVGDTTYAEGSFRFSDEPRWVPDSADGTTELSLVYPASGLAGTAQQIDELIQAAADGSGEAIYVPCEPEPGSSQGEVPSDPDFGADPETSVPAEGSAPIRGDAEAERDALRTLRRIAAEDDQPVSDAVTGRWLTQLSSKFKGLENADGIANWSYQDILAEHLRLRERYPDVRLINSSDWAFQRDRVWVTVIARPYPRWQPAVRWCVTQGFDRDHCFGKLLRRGDNWEQTTRYINNLP